MGALIHGNRSIIIDSGMGRHMSNIMLVPCKNMANRISRCFLNVEYGDWLDESSIRLNVSRIENIKIQEINGYDDPSRYYIAVFAKINKIPCRSQLVSRLNFHLPAGKQLVEERRHYFLVEMIVFFSRMK